MLLIADTSVLINFLKINQMHLLAKHDPRCAITNHVLDEVSGSYADQRQALEDALRAGHLDVITVDHDAEIELFASLQVGGRLGAGECSAIAVAIQRGYALAIDDKPAIRSARASAAANNSSVTIYGTKDLMVRLIQAGAVSLEQANFLLVEWRSKHQFKMDIDNFEEILSKP